MLHHYTLYVNRFLLFFCRNLSTIDLVEGSATGKVLFIGLIPAAKSLVYCDEIQLREVCLVFGKNLHIAGTVEILCSKVDV